MAISLVAASVEHIQATGYKGVLGTNPRSVCARIKTTALNATIIGWGVNNNGQKWVFRVQNTDGIAGATRLEVTGGFIVGDVAVNDGEWHHVAATWENGGTPDVTDAALYVDGVLVGTSASNPQVITTISGADVKVGIRGPDGDDIPFDGLIEDVRIYSTALTAEEIVEIYAAQGLDMNMRILPHLQLRLPMRGQDGVAVGTVKDFSPNGYDGTPMGSPVPVYAPGLIRLARVS